MASRRAICRPIGFGKLQNTSEYPHAQNQLARGGISSFKKSSRDRESVDGDISRSSKSSLASLGVRLVVTVRDGG